jgi:acetylornithine deacetylase/succinyl-diaminopimelate desuccinylase-like protein
MRWNPAVDALRGAAPRWSVGLFSGVPSVFKPIFAGLLAAALNSGVGLAQTPPGPAAGEAEFRSLFKQMVEIDTSYPNGSCSALVEQVAARMKAAGFPQADLHLFYPEEHPKDGSLVAVYPGRDPKAKAVLMLAHIDVVAAKREDWTRDPFKLVEEGGYFYARGVADMKGQAAIWADNLIRYHQEDYKPRRTIKMALTCGEDSAFVNGARWLAENQRELIDAGIALNEGGSGELDDKGARIDQTVEAAQKVPVTFIFETTNPGGHSSRPRPDNAIYSLVRAVERVSQYDFPVQFIDANRSYFTQMSKIVGGADGAAMTAILANPADKAAGDILNRNPGWHTMLRTTCVATMMDAGHAANALPQRARATIQCRLIPGVATEEVQAILTRLVADPEVSITTNRGGFPRAKPAPITDRVLGPVQKVSGQIWPGVPVVPYMAPAATDGTTLNAAGIPTYGISGLYRDPDGGGLHGLNERIHVSALLEGRQYLYRLVKAFADQPD